MIYNLKIVTKILLFSSIMISLLIFVSGVGYYYNSKANDDITSMYNVNFISVEMLNDNRVHARAVEADIYYIILNAQNSEEQNKKLSDIQNRAKNFDENWQIYKKTDLDKVELDKIQLVESNLNKYREVRNDAIKLAMEGKKEEALEKYKTIENTAEEFQKNLKELAEYNSKTAEEISIQNINNFNI